MCQECQELATNYNLNLNLLFGDLARAKGLPLSKKEKFYLCLSLLGYEPQNIAKKEELRGEFFPRTSDEFKRRSDNIRTAMCNTINGYIKNLIHESQDIVAQRELQEKGKILPWARILRFLCTNGYQNSPRSSRHEYIITIKINSEEEISPENLSNFLNILSQQLGDENINHENFLQNNEQND